MGFPTCRNWTYPCVREVILNFWVIWMQYLGHVVLHFKLILVQLDAFVCHSCQYDLWSCGLWYGQPFFLAIVFLIFNFQASLFLDVVCFRRLENGGSQGWVWKCSGRQNLLQNILYWFEWCEGLVDCEMSNEHYDFLFMAIVSLQPHPSLWKSYVNYANLV